MQPITEFNVLSHEIRATKGHNGQAVALQEVKHEPRTLWERMVALLPSPEEITVAGGKIVQKGIVLTPTMALTLLVAICAALGTVYWRMSDRIDAKDAAYQAQRDMLIEMKTELRLSKEHDLEYRGEFRNDLKLQQVYINHIVNLLTPEQKRDLERRSQANSQ